MCARCGSHIYTPDPFCPKCGQSLGTVQPHAWPQQRPQSTAQQLRPLLVVALPFLLIAVAALVYLAISMLSDVLRG